MGESDIPVVVHQPASLPIWPAVQSFPRALSTNPGVEYGAHVNAFEEIICVMYVIVQMGHSGDGCDLASTLCKYKLRKSYVFVLGSARVRRVKQRSIFSELLMCGGGFAHANLNLQHSIYNCFINIMFDLHVAC